MKNFEKFQSRALNSDALKQIKGGMFDPPEHCHPVTPECNSYYLSCASLCGDYYDFECCVLNQTMDCSPLQGFDNICYYGDCQ